MRRPSAVSMLRRLRQCSALVLAAALTACTVSTEDDRTRSYLADGTERAESNFAAGPHTGPIGGSDVRLRCGADIGPRNASHGLSPVYPTAGTVVDRALSSVLFGDDLFAHQAFRASRIHDMCYLHGGGSYGFSRGDCDINMTLRNRQVCTLSKLHDRQKFITETVLPERPNVPLAYAKAVQSTISGNACLMRMNVVDAVVGAFGGLLYGDNPQTNCPYGRGFLPPRDDHLIAARLDPRSDGLLRISRQGNDGLRLSWSSPLGAFGAGGFTIAFNQVHVHGLPPATPREPVCMFSNRCSLYDLGLTSRDFLSHTPLLADFDSDGLDELVLFGLDAQGIGVLALPIRLAGLVEGVRDLGHPAAFVMRADPARGPKWTELRSGMRLPKPTAEEISAEVAAFHARPLRMRLTSLASGGESLVLLSQTVRGAAVRTLAFAMDPDGAGALSSRYRAGHVTDDRENRQSCDGRGDGRCPGYEEGLIFSRFHYEPVPLVDPATGREAVIFPYRRRPELDIRNVVAFEPLIDFQMEARIWRGDLHEAIGVTPDPAKFQPDRHHLVGATKLMGINLPLEAYPWAFLRSGRFHDPDRTIPADDAGSAAVVSLYLDDAPDDSGALGLVVSEADLGNRVRRPGADGPPSVQTRWFFPPVTGAPSGDFGRYFFWVAPIQGAFGPAGEPGYLLFRPSKLGCEPSATRCADTPYDHVQIVQLWRQNGDWRMRSHICEERDFRLRNVEDARELLPVVLSGAGAQGHDLAIYARRGRGAEIAEYHVEPTREGLAVHTGVATLPKHCRGGPPVTGLAISEHLVASDK